ncbi:MAG: response regulator [Puniceicoccaceae bacterium]
MDEPKNSESCRILLAEDNKVNQKLALLILNRLGVSAETAESGQEAVDKAKAETFDLILMDLHMPGMDGVEATQIIKRDLGDKCPPIVALTADAMRGSDAEAMEKGLDDFMTKPINSGILKDCINKHTRFTV